MDFDRNNRSSPGGLRLVGLGTRSAIRALLRWSGRAGSIPEVPTVTVGRVGIVFKRVERARFAGEERRVVASGLCGYSEYA